MCTVSVCKGQEAAAAVVLRVMDEDVASDDALGHARVPLSDVHGQRATLPLSPGPGTVDVTLRWVE